MTHANDITTESSSEPTDVFCHVRSLLAKQHQIAIVWSTDDIRGLRPDLSEEQAWEALQQVEDIHDADCGVNWTTLETVAGDMFPAPDDSSQTGSE